MQRREFLRGIGLMGLMSYIAPQETYAALFSKEKPLKGFNLLNKFNPEHQTPFSEKDFEIIADWGFNFVRLPLSYWCWSKKDNWYHVDENILKEIDKAVEYGKKYKIHVNLNFHRVPGYCINPPHEKVNLFDNTDALNACTFHWKLFAERYKSHSSKHLSFNLINEAPSIADEKYDKVVRHLINTIRKISPKRKIIVDGLDVGARPLMSIAKEKNIIQSGRGYQPMLISHYEASWVYGNSPMYFPKEKLSWPLNENGNIYDKNWLRNTLNKNWQPLIKEGGKVHIGEFGCHNRTPHNVALKWLDDLLAIFEENNWGWSLWNLHGSFGVMDSYRRDVKYEEYKGHKLDRKMLELLLKYR